MLIANLVCGHPIFERRARRAVTVVGHEISLFSCSFQPDETLASRQTCARVEGGHRVVVKPAEASLPTARSYEMH